MSSENLLSLEYLNKNEELLLLWIISLVMILENFIALDIAFI